MTQNPFDALGGGGFDMNALLQQAQQMQQQLEEAQANLAQQTVEGTVAGGAVTVTANGVGELVGVTIRSGEFDGNAAHFSASAFVQTWRGRFLDNLLMPSLDRTIAVE